MFPDHSLETPEIVKHASFRAGANPPTPSFSPSPKQRSLLESNVHLIEQRTQEWLDLRRGKITGSAFNKALGIFEKQSTQQLKLPSSYARRCVEEIWLTMVFEILSKEEKEKEKEEEEENDIIDNNNNNNNNIDEENNIDDSNNNIDNNNQENLSVEILTQELEKLQFSNDIKLKMKWGTLHEPNAILSYLSSHDTHQISETGFWILEQDKMPCASKTSEFDPKDWPIDFHRIPPIGASPDGLIYDSDTEEFIGVLEAKCGCPFILNNNSSSSVKKNNNSNNSNNNSSSSSSSSSSSNKSNNTAKYKYISRKPFDQIPIYYIPQIQTQMMVTGASNCKFISWTPTRKSTVFDVPFDAEYCHMMLYFLQELYHGYILTQKRPPPDVFFSSETHRFKYETFLRRTREIQLQSAASKTVVDSEYSHQHDGKLFLE